MDLRMPGARQRKNLRWRLKPLEKLLVYEYVDNGNLEQWLYGEVGPVSPLTWDIRIKIAVGTAKGSSHMKLFRLFLQLVDVVYLTLQTKKSIILLQRGIQSVRSFLSYLIWWFNLTMHLMNKRQEYAESWVNLISSKVLELGMNFRTADDMNATLVVKLTRRLGFGMWAKLHLTGMHLEGKGWQKLDLSKANFLDMTRILQVEMRAPCTSILKALYLRMILWAERCP